MGVCGYDRGRNVIMTGKALVEIPFLGALYDRHSGIRLDQATRRMFERDLLGLSETEVITYFHNNLCMPAIVALDEAELNVYLDMLEKGLCPKSAENRENPFYGYLRWLCWVLPGHHEIMVTDENSRSYPKEKKLQKQWLFQGTFKRLFMHTLEDWNRYNYTGSGLYFRGDEARKARNILNFRLCNLMLHRKYDKMSPEAVEECLKALKDKIRHSTDIEGNLFWMGQAMFDEVRAMFARSMAEDRAWLARLRTLMASRQILGDFSPGEQSPSAHSLVSALANRVALLDDSISDLTTDMQDYKKFSSRDSREIGKTEYVLGTIEYDVLLQDEKEDEKDSSLWKVEMLVQLDDKCSIELGKDVAGRVRRHLERWTSPENPLTVTATVFGPNGLEEVVTVKKH